MSKSSSSRIAQGLDGQGEMLTPQQIKTALKINQQAQEKQDEFEALAIELDLDVEMVAQQLIRAPSPRGTRQIVRNVRPEDVARMSPI